MRENEPSEGQWKEYFRQMEEHKEWQEQSSCEQPWQHGNEDVAGEEGKNQVIEGCHGEKLRLY